MEPFDEERVKILSRQIAEGLKHLHEIGIVHRDIKPENILLSDVTEDCRPIIGDLGCSKVLREGETCKTFCGTKSYLAPEVLRGEPYSSPVDIWSFGVMMYLMITGSMPFP